MVRGVPDLRIFSKQAHLDGLEALGKDHPDYDRLKDLVERKFDSSRKANLNALQMKEMHKLVIEGGIWKSKQGSLSSFDQFFKNTDEK